MELAVALHAFMKTRTVLQMENLALRHQLLILSRSTPKCPQLKATGRLFWIGISRLCADCRTWLVIVQPETDRWLAQNPVSGFLDIEDPPRQTRPARSSQRHPRTDPPHEPGEPDMGAPRVYGELLKLGIEIAESSVSKIWSGDGVLRPRRGAPSFRTTSMGWFPSTSSLSLRFDFRCSMSLSCSRTSGGGLYTWA